MKRPRWPRGTSGAKVAAPKARRRHCRRDSTRSIQMRARFVLPVLAAACVSFLAACGGVSPDPQRPDRSNAITHGTLDGNGHPAVVLIVMDVGGQPAFRCSGTLIAPKVV